MNLVRLDRVNRDILGLAVPALGALAIDPLLTLADTAFVARLGTAELAALGVDAAILTFAFFAFNFLSFVTTPLVAKAIGRGQPQEARHYVGAALYLAVVLGLIMTVLVEVLASGLVGAMGAEGVVAADAVSYLRIRALATTAVLVVTAANGAFRGYKNTRTPLLVMAVVNGINVVLDPLLIFGFDMGLQGAAVATVVAQVFGAVWFVRLIAKRQMGERPRSLAESLPILKTLGKNGLLLSLRTAFLLAAFTFAASTATRIGPRAIAAHQLVAQIFLLATMVADSLEIAGQAMLAEQTSSGDLAAVKSLTRRLMGWGAGVGLTLFAFVGLGRYALPLLTPDDAVAALAVEAAGVAAVVLLVGALVFVADGVFVGLLALGVMALSTGAGAVVSIPLMAWSPLGDTLPGIWWALGVFLAVRGVIFLFAYGRSAEIAVRS